MKLKLHLLHFIILFCFIFTANGQNVSLFHQFNGRYDFTFIGNTLNVQPNFGNDPCLLLPSSDAILNLDPNDTIISAYLYWAGSGTGDFNVKLNGIEIDSQRNFLAIQNLNGNPFFSAFAEVTTLIQTTGNGVYSFSDLDVTPFFNPDTYCNNGTNFAGWAIVIVYENASLPINQVNVYDGLEALSSPNPGVVIDELTINLSNLYVLDNTDAKVGFIAWEGDANISNQESLLINGNILSDAINPPDNAFNGTNNITGTSDLYNMDLDIYDIQPYINAGNTSAEIKMTTAQDFVLISTIVTKLNNKLPDAIVAINAVEQQCDSRILVLNYTVSNLNSSGPLPSGTPIAIYADGTFIAFDETILPIPIGGSANFQLSLVVPDSIPMNFTLTISVDDNGNGTGIVDELNESNNKDTIPVSLWRSPTFNVLEPLKACNEGFTKATFDFSSYEDLVKTNPNDVVHFYETVEDASAAVNPILNTTNYEAITTPKEIFIRISNGNCFATTSFILKSRNCPPTVYNFVSANNDSYNDSFFIGGLRDIFLDFQLEVYNRWGQKIWTGYNTTENWNGYIKDGIGNKNAPDGTYFYLLFLNDTDYPQPLKGFLYLNH
ncbi:gliding motility-associated C-terminal domain-containing protein [Flavobacterium sp.]|uniref:T9SS type B sorting domain-containing protein n=1 Tax=Flavobacterium sp. TaxID=239 RepID=UPI002487E196|nr:gliding motility-associated C-terminal domain-containing protein [Flavobacterium sp.]MDI1316508.1 gliding motility-associated C-terminal domain-containing protein [Flavobacterium sp.]